MIPTRDLPPDAWIGPGVSIGWLSRRTPPGVENEVHTAWQKLFHEPDWLGWMADHADVLYSEDVHMFLWVEDRSDTRSRHTRRSLDYYVPVEEFFDPTQVRQLAREIIHGMYTKRATKAGIPPPPAV